MPDEKPTPDTDDTSVPSGDTPAPAVADDAAPEKGASNAEAAAKVTVDELPLTVMFVAGQLQGTVGSLQQFTPGYFIDLQKAVDRQVDITVNGVCLGKGELVEVDGRAGVRILEYGQGGK
ncbi:MAG: FliM/FliN family flagellar motor switch protein [Gammaproteobacteria bacterium]